jgi:hypothetical protein
MLAHPNRLTVAHLLLWTATSGAALAYQLEQKPPPPEKIGFASLLVGAGQDPKIVRAKAQQRIHRAWQTKYEIGLVFAPVYGAALSGAVLAMWRVATMRFGFPTQPGHWLFLIVASLIVAHVLHPWLRPYLDWADGPDFGWSIFLTLAATAITVGVREPRWRCAIGMVAVGFGTMVTSYFISLNSNRFEPPGLFVVGGLFVAAFPFGVLFCTFADFAERKRYDVFHWIGVATLAGVVLHFLAVAQLARYG